MATLTYQHSSFADGIVRVEFDVNDANWRMSQVRCINNSLFPAKATIFELGDLVFTANAPAGQTTSWNTVGVQLVWNDVDENLEMGDYVMCVQWPSGG